MLFLVAYESVIQRQLYTNREIALTGALFDLLWVALIFYIWEETTDVMFTWIQQKKNDKYV